MFLFSNQYITGNAIRLLNFPSNSPVMWYSGRVTHLFNRDVFSMLLAANIVDVFSFSLRLQMYDRKKNMNLMKSAFTEAWKSSFRCIGETLLIYLLFIYYLLFINLFIKFHM